MSGIEARSLEEGFDKLYKFFSFFPHKKLPSDD